MPDPVPGGAGCAPAGLDAVDRRIIDSLQGGFPLVAEPYAAVAGALGLSEAELLARLVAALCCGAPLAAPAAWCLRTASGRSTAAFRRR